METVEIRGLNELRRAMQKTIPFEMQGKVLQKALAAGAKLTLKAARDNAKRGGSQFPDVVSGTLSRAIYAKRSKFDNTTTYESRVIGVRRGNKYGKNRVKAGKSNMDAYYWKFVEFGHRIGTKKTGYLRKYRDLSRITGRAGRVAVPDKGAGTVEAQPFMRPAFEATKNAALEAIRAELLKLIEEAAKKASWK